MKAAKNLTPIEINALRAENRELRKQGERLELTARKFLERMDALLKNPDAYDGKTERGKEAARLMNALNLELDKMTYFALKKPLVSRDGSVRQPAARARQTGVILDKKLMGSNTAPHYAGQYRDGPGRMNAWLPGGAKWRGEAAEDGR